MTSRESNTAEDILNGCGDCGCVGDEEELLKKEFHALQADARNEFKNVRARILQQYEDRLTEAKRQYMEDAASSREKLLANRQTAREEYEGAIRNAKIDYEFAVDVVKDHYQTMRKESTRTIRLNQAAARAEAQANENMDRQNAPTRIMERLDAEIRRIAAKKEQVRKETDLIPLTAHTP